MAERWHIFPKFAVGDQKRDTGYADRCGNTIRKQLDIGLRIAAAAQPPLAKLMRDSVVELLVAQRFAHVNDPARTVVKDQRATGQLVVWHELQAALAE